MEKEEASTAAAAAATAKKEEGSTEAPAAEKEEVVAVARSHASKRRSPQDLPRLAAVVLHRLHTLPSPLGERTVHLAVAGAAHRTAFPSGR